MNHPRAQGEWWRSHSPRPRGCFTNNALATRSVFPLQHEIPRYFSQHNRTFTRKMFPFDDVIMLHTCTDRSGNNVRWKFKNDMVVILINNWLIFYFQTMCIHINSTCKQKYRLSFIFKHVWITWKPSEKLQRAYRWPLHYSEITACVLCGLIPNLIKRCLCVFPIFVRQLLKYLTARQLIKTKTVYYSPNKYA